MNELTDPPLRILYLPKREMLAEGEVRTMKVQLKDARNYAITFEPA